MKTFVYVLIISGFLWTCGAPHSIANQNPEVATPEQDTVRIENDDLDYEIIIIEPGFNTWLATVARPEGYYSQPYLESRNRVWVTEWNIRVLQPYRYNTNLYEMQINYDPTIDYGYEVNYKLFNYFVYFQLRYKQQLGGFVPRI